MHRLLLLLALGLVPCCPATRAQPAPSDTARVEADPLAPFEFVAEDGAAEAPDPEAIAERLHDLAAAPLDLNTASAAELAQLPMLPALTAHRIAGHRQRHGPFASLEALAAVEGVTAATILAIRPFVTATPRPPDGAAPADARLRLTLLQRLVTRRDPASAGDEPATDGAPFRLYTRLRARRGDRLAFHVTLEQDPGEPFAWDPGTRTYGYDFTSASLLLQDAGPFERLVVGDFNVRLGQGLVLWQGGAFGKGSDPVRAVERTGSGAGPYGSSDEQRFFRGVAAVVRLPAGLAATVFASRRHLDAALSGDTSATSLPETGLHRTPQERARKSALGHDLAGGHLGWQRGGLALGATGYLARFAAPVQTGSQPARRFAFEGSEAAAGSVFVDFVAGRYHVFGEAAVGTGGAPGATGGVAAAGPAGSAVVVHVRHFPARFVSLYGDAFGEYGGSPQNETGYYAGLQFEPAPGWDVRAFFDQYGSPWLRAGTPRPARGAEALVSATYTPRRWLRAALLLRSETREAGAAAPDADGHLLDGLRATRRRSARFEGTFTYSPRLRLRTRLEGVYAMGTTGDEERGVLLYQDVRLQVAPWLRLDARLTFFDTDGFASRLFAYEDDLRYAFSIPALQGRGERSYVLVHVHPSPHLTLQAKAGKTRLAAPSSPDTAPPGRSSFGVQLLVAF